ncbi:FAD-binding protein [Altererythrobacter confluentis]|uniref:FAD-binding protein n=1 Tax=Allopontixanthobacter confluentis TaxID=1849021 RepID=A0A6L7GJE9_9SPHN|nr:GMC family oxidoreductase N-terminal domain-containing protein [Allopontixanthobacter confluentis]MXP15058.1 FAD-binding protein [Allopontixanthobacter confluentis]
MDQFDIIVIGAGSAGSAAAARLARDGKRRVCLIEAGGKNTHMFTRTPGLVGMMPDKSNWGFDTEPMEGLGGRIGYQPRGRGMGGSSATNGMVYIRGNPWDYDNWANLGCTGWGWDDVLPVFRRQEDSHHGAGEWHGTGGPLHVNKLISPSPVASAFVEAAEQLQIPRNDDFNGPRQEGFGLYDVTQHNGERWSAARAFVDPLAGKPNFEVLTDALVERIVIVNDRATGVIISTGGKQQTLQAAAGVVLSAGAFGSPQILMLSGVGPGAELTRHGIAVTLDKPAVGADLQDHCDFVAGYTLDDPSLFGGSLKVALRVAKGLVEHRFRRTGMLTTNYAESGGFVTIRPDAPAPDVQYHFIRAIIQNHGRDKLKESGFSLHACVLRPESRGWVKLSSADPAAAPAINPNFLSDQRDMDLLIDGAKLMQRIAQTPPLSTLGAVDRNPINFDDRSEAETRIRAVADTIYHPVGTCRMGPDADAVVDPTLAMKGIDNLWVADASIMPRLISGNTNAPSIMIGERCGDFVEAALH